MKNTISRSLLCFLLLFSGGYTFAQNSSSAEGKQWLQSRVWAKQLRLKLFDDVNSTQFQHQYSINKDVWDKVFVFLADSNKLRSLPTGKYPIDGDNAYAVITDAPTKAFDDSKWESHRKYIDLQYVIRGEEKIGVAPVNTATVTEPYNAAADIAHYTAAGKYYLGTPSVFYLFFPSDAHRPNIKVDGYDTDKKLVIKINYVNSK